MSAAREATSRKAREVAHPQLFRAMFKDKPALYFPRKVARPPDERVVGNQCADAHLLSYGRFGGYLNGKPSPTPVDLPLWTLSQRKSWTH